MTLVPFATTTLTELWGTVVVVVVAPLWPLWPAWVVVVVVAAAAPALAVDVVVPAPLAAVVGVVLGVLLTLGRVPTATRTVTATTKRMRTAAARTMESEPDDPVCG